MQNKTDFLAVVKKFLNQVLSLDTQIVISGREELNFFDVHITDKSERTLSATFSDDGILNIRGEGSYKAFNIIKTIDTMCHEMFTAEIRRTCDKEGNI